MKNFFALAIALSVFAACNNSAHQHEDRKDGFSDNAKTPEDSLFQLVMDGHDVGMANIGKIRASLALAKAGLDSVAKLKDSPEKEKLQQAFMDIQEDLNYAEYGMNTWMAEFNPDSATGNMDARIKYLSDEKTKVDKVKESILSSLQRADSLFRK
ncbi:hypothetical protein [Flavihumibacter fluvii]|uniref:hypothetical protein n=1 Tax=Flavihumibacter fluvii TaxID=2838157 RepID=UPI001BDE4C8F|nr:hypothetical protein [Flavihumibacter fluvii]ULQ51863.1 hypothetical protein KJS93_17380 [Flavihumibacter fluvii]